MFQGRRELIAPALPGLLGDSVDISGQRSGTSISERAKHRFEGLPQAWLLLPSLSMIHQLVYSSTATQEFWPDDLFNLVEVARKKNALRAVTGMLLYHEGEFLQLLEGPEREVKSVFELVKRDRRHRGVKVVFSAPASERQFPDWTMGFERLDEAWSIPRAWATVLEDGFNSEQIVKHPSAARDLLLSFRHAVQERKS